jgi:hypothetical protein
VSDPLGGRGQRSAALRRRVEQRHRRRLRVTFEAGGHSHVGFTMDVSRAGVFVATSQAPPVARSMELCVELPDGDLVRLSGRVSWKREPPAQLATMVRRGFGVQLIEPPESWCEFIASLDRPAG